MSILNPKNNKLILTISLLWALLSLASKPLLATDSLPTELALSESIQAEQLAKTLKPGEALWLEVDQDKFLTIFTPDVSDRPKGGAILLHDANAHPDWPDVIRPLRTSLPSHGWATISIQLPNINKIDGYLPYHSLINSRIQKAAEHLQSIGLNNIALIGHGSGALAAAAYLANGNTHPAIRGFIGIGLSVILTDQNEDYLLSHIEKIKLPMLDIYGSRDLTSVTSTATERSLAAKKSSRDAASNNEREAYKKAGLSITTSNIQGYITYRQIVIEGADHDFEGQSEVLNKRVLGWLERHTNGTAITPSR